MAFNNTLMPAPTSVVGWAQRGDFCCSCSQLLTGTRLDWTFKMAPSHEQQRGLAVGEELSWACQMQHLHVTFL